MKRVGIFSSSVFLFFFFSSGFTLFKVFPTHMIMPQRSKAVFFLLFFFFDTSMHLKRKKEDHTI